MVSVVVNERQTYNGDQQEVAHEKKETNYSVGIILKNILFAKFSRMENFLPYGTIEVGTANSLTLLRRQAICANARTSNLCKCVVLLSVSAIYLHKCADLEVFQ